MTGFSYRYKVQKIYFFFSSPDMLNVLRRPVMRAGAEAGLTLVNSLKGYMTLQIGITEV